MPGRQAKVIRPAQLRVLLRHVRHHSDPIRSRAIVLLSVKAGLRAAEIAKLEWPMVLDAGGKVSSSIEIDDRIAKKGSGRRVPMHPELRDTLTALLRRTARLLPRWPTELSNTPMDQGPIETRESFCIIYSRAASGRVSRIAGTMNHLRRGERT